MTRLLIEHEDAARRRVAFLEFAKESGSIDDACIVYGYSKSSYYLFRRLYAKYGEMGLRSVTREKPNLKNRVDPEIEDAVVAFGLQNPMYGQQKVSELLKEQGISVSASGVRSIWLRHNMQSAQKRIKASANSHRFLLNAR